MMKQLESTKAHFLKERIESSWDITDHYWYPLNECKRSDVLAFDHNIIEEVEEKITDVRHILLKLNYNSVYEMNEDRLVWLIDTNTLVPAMGKYNDERFWFSEDMSWIIYVSHEGSITFGGEELLNQIKLKSDDWQSKIFAPEYGLNEGE
jgi:hypothetical protein